MSLLVVCEPLFQYVCRLNRSARKGAQADLMTVRNDILATLEDMEKTAASDPDLIAQFDKVRMPLIFYVDFTIKESDLEFANQWEEIARDYGEHAGDEKFYDLLDETLQENSMAANERLAVFYTCMGLGFTGFYTGQPEYLRRKMTEMAGRIRSMMDVNETVRVCPEAYENVDSSNLISPPGKKIVGIGLLTVCLIILVLAVQFTLFYQSRSDLSTSLETLIGENATAADSSE